MFQLSRMSGVIEDVCLTDGGSLACHPAGWHPRHQPLLMPLGTPPDEQDYGTRNRLKKKQKKNNVRVSESQISGDAASFVPKAVFDIHHVH